jgi:hypothetical protein
MDGESAKTRYEQLRDLILDPHPGQTGWRLPVFLSEGMTSWLATKESILAPTVEVVPTGSQDLRQSSEIVQALASFLSSTLSREAP